MIAGCGRLVSGPRPGWSARPRCPGGVLTSGGMATGAGGAGCTATGGTGCAVIAGTKGCGAGSTRPRWPGGTNGGRWSAGTAAGGCGAPGFGIVSGVCCPCGSKRPRCPGGTRESGPGAATAGCGAIPGCSMRPRCPGGTRVSGPGAATGSCGAAACGLGCGAGCGRAVVSGPGAPASGRPRWPGSPGLRPRAPPGPPAEGWLGWALVIGTAGLAGAATITCGAGAAAPPGFSRCTAASDSGLPGVAANAASRATKATGAGGGAVRATTGRPAKFASGLEVGAAGPITLRWTGATATICDTGALNICSAFNRTAERATGCDWTKAVVGTATTAPGTCWLIYVTLPGLL